MKKLDHVLILGLDASGNVLATGKARVKEGSRWATPKNIKRYLLKRHAIVSFKRQNIWAVV